MIGGGINSLFRGWFVRIRPSSVPFKIAPVFAHDQLVYVRLGAHSHTHARALKLELGHTCTYSCLCVCACTYACVKVN